MKCNAGLIGLAVMGQNLVLNMERNGFSVAVFNRTSAKTDEFMKEKAEGKNITPARTIAEFVNLLESPRKIFIMVKAGQPVDDTIEALLPHLDKGDIIVDGGNSHYPDTRRRDKFLAEKEIRFMGTGISGGEEGALNGACIMPGGDKEAFALVENILNAISAKVNNEPCCAYMGPRDAGHFVKMVHNGIEYADMQVIAEVYDFLKRFMGMQASDIRDTFISWNEGVLNSYLLEITIDILNVNDPGNGRLLLDYILDSAQQKGTGKWTSQAALELGAPIPAIDAALFARIISSMKDERVKAANFYEYKDDTSGFDPLNPMYGSLINTARIALLCSRISVYAQGMAMLKKASLEFGFELDLSVIAKIWRGGCIIRSALLESISEAFTKNPDLDSLLMDNYFSVMLKKGRVRWGEIVSFSVAAEVACPAISSCIQYFDSYRTPRLPANLIQAQRDYFGAHTYKRIDKEGNFHTDWKTKP
ncbi:MAG: NADP-dependent phosphogluconate dehydrogenase [Firmicutes bacterium]|nr:NADP-dependent phosphogluconate dehydrogenase [Bacillota bacterium]